MISDNMVMVPRAKLEQCAKIIRTNLHHQREKVSDAAAILDELTLSASPVPPSEPVGWRTIGEAAAYAVGELMNPDASDSERMQAADILRKAVGMPMRHAPDCAVNAEDFDGDGNDCTCTYWDAPVVPPSPPVSGDNGKLKKRPVAFRVKEFVSGHLLFNTEDEARKCAAELGCEYQGLYVRDGTPLNFSDPPARHEVFDALQWALAEIEGRTTYENDDQRVACLERARAALSDPPASGEGTAASWTCRRCNWSGPSPETTGAMHPSGYGYKTPLCPECGHYFSETEISRNAPPASGEVLEVLEDADIDNTATVDLARVALSALQQHARDNGGFLVIEDGWVLCKHNEPGVISEADRTDIERRAFADAVQRVEAAGCVVMPKELTSDMEERLGTFSELTADEMYATLLSSRPKVEP